jgi:uncharacterized protein YciI
MTSNLKILVFLMVSLTGAQSKLPDFLPGTWQLKNKRVYEHRDKLSANSLREFSCKKTKQIVKTTEADTVVMNPNYDPELAIKLGADQYGMRSYILVILKTGSNQTADRDFITRSFRGHMENINRLVAEGKLIVAGPLGQNDKAYRGIYILDVATVEEAQLLLQTDPAIKNGLLDAEIYNWYGSAALPQYLPSSDKIWKLKP